MKKLFTLTFCLALCQTFFAQTVTTVEKVYGGRINAITGDGISGTPTDSFRVIVSTESANSLYYADIKTTALGAVTTVHDFTVFPSANGAAGYGSGIQKIAYHGTSETTFFIANGNIYSTSITATGATAVTTSGGYSDIVIKGNHICEMSTSGSNNTFYVGTVDASGVVTISSSATIAGQAYTGLIAGKDNKLYAFKEGTDPQAVQFGNTFSSGIDLTTTTTDAMGTLSASYNWKTMGVYSDGTVFVGGDNGSYKYVANATSFGGAYTNIATGISGVSGKNIEFRTGLIGNYYVYFGTAYSTAKGAVSTWTTFGNAGLETHPNDGAVFNLNESIPTGGNIILTTDQGLGISQNSGAVIYEIDNGIEATQVYGFDMNAAKDFGWLSSKDGVRYVSGYNTASKAWSKALFPNGDGSPYYSVEMMDEGASAFVGNVRVYKTTDTGKNWTKVFTAEDAPYNFASVFTEVRSIAVCNDYKNVVMAGYKLTNGTGRGGAFYSLDSGKTGTWHQLHIYSAVDGQDVNVNDIELVSDGGKVYAYIGVDYDSTASPIIRGMYKAELNGTTWTVAFEDVYGAATSLYSVKDIVIQSKDTILATGTFYNPALKYEYGINFALSKTGTNAWSSSVPSTARSSGFTACSWHVDSFFYAYQNIIYFYKVTFGSTVTSRTAEATYSSVDVGTEIDVLYYDELLAGTGTGFISIRGAKAAGSAPSFGPPNTACAGTNIAGVNPTGGNFYIVNNAANGYVKQTADGRYIVMLATNGILTGSVSYSFSTSNAAIAAYPNATLSTFNEITKFPNTAGTYQIAYAVDNYSRSSAANTVNVTDVSVNTPITGLLNICNIGGTTILRTETWSGIWASSNTSIATLSSGGSGSNTIKVTAVGFGSTNISYTIGSGSCSSISNATINVAPSNITPITGPSSVCVNGQINLANTTLGGTWASLNNRASVSNTGQVTGGTTGGTVATITYTLPPNIQGCSVTATKSIAVNPLPAIPSVSVSPAIGNTNAICNGRTFQFTGNPAGGSWSTTNASVATITGGGSMTTVGIGTATMKYTVNNAGCSNSRSFSGTVIACFAREANTTSSIQQISLYPNPARSVVSVQVNKLIGEGSIVITDIYGKTIRSYPLRQAQGDNGMNNSSVQTLDISQFSKGIYLVNVITSEGKTTKKLIVE